MSCWPTRMGNNRRTGFVDDELIPPLSLAWKYKVGGYIWSGPTISNRQVFIGGDSLSALNLLTGELLWKSEGIKAWEAASAAVTPDLVCVCCSESLYILKRSDGSILHKIPPGSRASSPCLANDIVIWGGVDGSLHAARIASGERLWSFKVNEEDPIRFTPSINENVVFVSGYKSFFALNSETGTLIWQRNFDEFPQEPKGSAAIFMDKIIVSINQRGLIALDIEDGSICWEFQTKFGPHTAPAVSEVDKIAYVAGWKLHAVLIDDGHEVWSTEEMGLKHSAPIVVGETIYIGGGHFPFIYAFSLYKGTLIWEYPTNDLVFSSPAYSEGHLVCGSHDGNVYCFKRA